MPPVVEDPKFVELRAKVSEAKGKLLLLKKEQFRNDHLKNYKEAMEALKSIDMSLLEPYDVPVPEEEKREIMVEVDYIK